MRYRCLPPAPARLAAVYCCLPAGPGPAHLFTTALCSRFPPCSLCSLAPLGARPPLTYHRVANAADPSHPGGGWFYQSTLIRPSLPHLVLATTAYDPSPTTTTYHAWGPSCPSPHSKISTRGWKKQAPCAFASRARAGSACESRPNGSARICDGIRPFTLSSTPTTLPGYSRSVPRRYTSLPRGKPIEREGGREGWREGLMSYGCREGECVACPSRSTCSHCLGQCV